MKIRGGVNPSFRNKREFLQAIDALPRGVDWQCESVALTGDLEDDEGTAQVEDLELWYRDPVECIREILGNPLFRDCTRYAPERLYTKQDGGERVVDECWTGDWWWDVQVCSPVPKLASVVLTDCLGTPTYWCDRGPRHLVIR